MTGTCFGSTPFEVCVCCDFCASIFYVFISDAAIFAHSSLRAAVLSLTLVRAELLIRLSRVALKSSVKVYHEYVAFLAVVIGKMTSVLKPPSVFR